MPWPWEERLVPMALTDLFLRWFPPRPARNFLAATGTWDFQLQCNAGRCALHRFDAGYLRAHQSRRTRWRTSLEQYLCHAGQSPAAIPARRGSAPPRQPPGPRSRKVGPLVLPKFGDEIADWMSMPQSSVATSTFAT